MKPLDTEQSHPAGMRSVGSTSGDEGFTVLLTVTDDELYFSGSIRRSDLEKLAPRDSESNEKANQFLDAAKALLNAAHGNDRRQNCGVRVSLALEVHGRSARLETEVHELTDPERKELGMHEIDNLFHVVHEGQPPAGAGAFESGHSDTAERAEELLGELGFGVGPG